jgi:hypothetical protein
MCAIAVSASSCRLGKTTCTTRRTCATVAVATGITGHDTRLAIGHFVECSAPLAGDRIAGLFGEIAAIDEQHRRVAIAQRVRHQLLVRAQHPVILPRPRPIHCCLACTSASATANAIGSIDLDSRSNSCAWR